jgi:hypothetical protein
MFFVSHAGRFIDHIHHAFHHNFTIKTPHETLAFRRTPIKKRPSNLEKRFDGRFRFFSSKKFVSDYYR